MFCFSFTVNGELQVFIFISTVAVASKTIVIVWKRFIHLLPTAESLGRWGEVRGGSVDIVCQP